MIARFTLEIADAADNFERVATAEVELDCLALLSVQILGWLVDLRKIVNPTMMQTKTRSLVVWELESKPIPGRTRAHVPIALSPAREKGS